LGLFKLEPFSILIKYILLCLHITGYGTYLFALVSAKIHYTHDKKLLESKLISKIKNNLVSF